MSSRHSEQTFLAQSKGQAAIEYLMNYAWAIALIIIVGIAIFGLNIGGVRNLLSAQSSQVTQAGEQVAVIGYVCDINGKVSISLQNNGAGLVKNISLTVSNETTYRATTCTGTQHIFPGQTIICENTPTNLFNLTCAKQVGQPYKIQVNFSYIDDTTGLTHKPVRNFTGTVQAG